MAKLGGRIEHKVDGELDCVLIYRRPTCTELHEIAAMADEFHRVQARAGTHSGVKSGREVMRALDALASTLAPCVKAWEGVQSEAGETAEPTLDNVTALLSDPDYAELSTELMVRLVGGKRAEGLTVEQRGKAYAGGSSSTTEGTGSPAGVQRTNEASSTAAAS